MKIKVRKYFITFLSLGLILSNFSFATVLVFCNMGSVDQTCACSRNNHTEKSELVLKSVAKSCCDKKIVELSNSNILEILHSNTVNPLIHYDLLSSGSNELNKIALNTGRIFSEFSYHPPNSEIPILNSSLLI